MQFNNFTPIPEEDEELHLPELVYWSSIGDTKEVLNSLKAGIDVNQTDDEGYSALQAAAENDHLEIVQLLVHEGADIAYKGKFTALELAEMAGNQAIVNYFKSL